MRLSHLLPLLLAGSLANLVACGSDEPGAKSEGPPTSGSNSPSSDDDDDPKDAGVSRDGGKRDSGPSKPVATVDDDDPNACDKLSLNGRPNAPDILIVLDRSGSMVGLGDPRNAGKNRWMPSVSAVKKLTGELTETVAFGLMLFPSTGAGPGGGGITIPGIGTFGGGGGGGGCAPGQLDVPVELQTADQISSVLDMSQPDVGATPTAATLEAALTALDTGTCGDCKDVPKYVLLVTDGQPTCGASGMSTTPEDIAATNAAIDKLTEKGIKTYVIGYDTASDPDAAAAMDEFAMHGGTEKHFPVEDEATLLSELTAIAGALVPCEFELSMNIPDPTYVRVEIDGVSYAYETDWTVEGRKIILRDDGGACPVLRDAKLHDLKITRECKQVMLL
jgi:hypothetical protein